MVSPASSDAAGSTHAAGLPNLPVPQPKPVQYLGTTWVERGPAYWTRRVLLFVGRCFIVLLMAVFAGSACYAVATSHLAPGSRTAAFAGMGVLAMVGFGLGVREAVRGSRSRLTPQELREQRAAANSRRPWPLRLATLRIVLVLLLPLSAPVLFGFVLSWLPGTSLGRDLPEEREARAELTEARKRYEALARKVQG